MTRSNQWLIASLALALGGALPAVHALATTGAQTMRQVNINMTCPADLTVQGITVTVNPWIRTVSPGDTVRWNVAGTQETLTLTSENWPLPSPLTGDPDIEATVPGDAEPGDYSYAIELECNGVTVLIDPGMRIGG